MLLVGNHSGGNLTPDTGVFTLAFSAYFGVERPFYQLAHNLVLSLPGLGFLRKFGTVAASPENADAGAAQPGAALLVYPGGDHEVHRPSGSAAGSTSTAARASSASRSSRTCRSCRWSRSAARRPRSSSRAASGLARLLRLDRLLRLKVLPISLALPWGLNVGDMLGHLPLPAKIVVEVLPPIDLREEFGAEPDVDEVYDEVVAPHAGHARRARRRAALAGPRMRVDASTIEIAAPREAVWELVTDPARYLHFMDGVTRWEVAGESRARPRRALPDAHARGLGRGRRAGRGRGVRRARATSRGRRSPASTSAGAGGCASPGRAGRGSSCA